MRTGLSALKGVMCLLGVMALTGAKTNGCGPDFGDDGEPPVECPDGFEFDGQACVPTEPPPNPECPPDSVPQWTCAEPADPTEPMPHFDDDGNVGSGGGSQGSCWLECVPVGFCPEGTIEQTVCADSEPPYPGDDDPGYEERDGEDSGSGGDDRPEVPPSECWTECVPVDQCGPGYHEELVCPPGCMESECYITCVPDCPDVCPPGSHLETICDQFGCYETCISDGDCPPGSHVEWSCDEMTGECFEYCEPDNQCAPGEHVEYFCDDFGCYEYCVPDDPCGPDAHLETECDQFGCYEICVPNDYCPEGTHGEERCFDDGTCSFECVPDDPAVCPDGTQPEIICDEMGCYEVCLGEPEPAPMPFVE